MNKVNRNYKASVFTRLFGEPKNELELYNAFSSVQYPPDTPVIDLTLSDALYMERVNDLSFSVAGKLVVFFEHQASINENMPLRNLLYCGRIYEKLIDNSMMYSEKHIIIPTPEFYILYNGIAPFPEKVLYRLSDSYAESKNNEIALDLTVTAYNVNKGYNEKIVKKSENLYGYVTLVSKAREHEQNGLKRSEAVKKAIDECIDLGILVSFLNVNASEVTNMLLQEWNWDDAKAVWQREAEERGEARGEARGIKLGEERGRAQSDKKWESITAEKDALIAKLQAQLSKNKNN